MELEEARNLAVVIVRRCGATWSPEAREDVVQEALIKYAAARSTAALHNPAAWLETVIGNLFLPRSPVDIADLLRQRCSRAKRAASRAPARLPRGRLTDPIARPLSRVTTTVEQASHSTGPIRRPTLGSNALKRCA